MDVQKPLCSLRNITMDSMSNRRDLNNELPHIVFYMNYSKRRNITFTCVIGV